MNPRQVLGVPEDAGDEQIRAAYLQKVKEHPPDRSPEEFERIRDAYQRLRDSRSRMRDMLFHPDHSEPLISVLPVDVGKRRFAGPAAWLEVIKRK